MFNQPTTAHSNFSWLTFGLLGILISLFAPFVRIPEVMATVHFMQIFAVAIIILFVSTRLLRLITSEGL